MKKLGVLDSIERQIANQQEIGGAVKIAFADYGATIMSRQELYAAFKDIVKTYEDGLTMNELRQRQKILKVLSKRGKNSKNKTRLILIISMSVFLKMLVLVPFLVNKQKLRPK